MAGLKLQAVTKSWDNGKTQVIQPLTMDVADGEFIVMVGPSGCGKSTLLRMVAGLERVSSGDIWIDRQRVTEMEPKERGIAMVFQNYALYPHMNVEENMAWGLKIRGMGKAHIAERVKEAARILELDGLLKRRPRELSGGQRQRVAMGRAIHARGRCSSSMSRSQDHQPARHSGGGSAATGAPAGSPSESALRRSASARGDWPYAGGGAFRIPAR
ncbi:SN-glycerol-3-phosphate transport ATP-binding protein UgpC (TC 3.A.1.1.3) [Cronobacter malonaticus 507]|nr:SN-glycerol-3-phosphate transport ATP-binding protein UgpC (TC 3.A.1.1.3) [Cronobacter malonaticus 507]